MLTFDQLFLTPDTKMLQRRKNLLKGTDRVSLHARSVSSVKDLPEHMPQEHLPERMEGTCTYSESREQN